MRPRQAARSDQHELQNQERFSRFERLFGRGTYLYNSAPTSMIRPSGARLAVSIALGGSFAASAKDLIGKGLIFFS